MTNVSGPIFDGRADQAVDDFIHQAEIDAANEGERMVRTNLHGVLKHPTGRYESHIDADANRVHDDGMIYGPWLEGTGSRNRSTRFKGYATFRRTAQELDRKVRQIAETTLRSYIGRMR